MRRHAWHPVAVAALSAAALSAAAITRGGQGTAGDAKALDEALISFDAAYNAHDAKALAAHFAEDSELVFPGGERLKGRSAIERGMAEYFAANPKARTRDAITSRRFLRSDLVLQEGYWAESGNSQAGSPAKGLFSVVLTRQEGRWLILWDLIWIPASESSASDASKKE